MPLQIHLALLVLLAAVMHATWNAVLKANGERFLTFTIMAATGTGLGIMAAPFVAVPEAATWPYLIASALIHTGYSVFLLRTYRHGDLSQVYPLARGTAPLAITVLAAFFAGEVPNSAGLTGVALISLGIVSLMFAGGRARGTALKPVLLALVTTLFIASYTVVDGLGLRGAASPWSFIVWLNILVGIPFMIGTAFFAPREFGRFLRTGWKPGFAGGVLSVVAYAIVLYALGQGAMAHVSALRETSVLFAALIGMVAFGEPLGWRRVACAIAIVAGMIVLQVSG
jgi:drug/metabolite transporter (DMT)-like permease